MSDDGELFPHFFVIGAQKAGTSTLCAMLDAHPRIIVSNPKEPRIVSRMDLSVHPQMAMHHIEWWREAAYGDPREWVPRLYAEVFPDRRGDSLLGDGTTGTMLSRLAPGLIHDFRPAAKIIVILRHPVLRAYSAYWHHLRNGTAAADIRTFLLLENNFAITTGCYEAVLRPWLATFPRDQILVLVYEEFFKASLTQIDLVTDFLGVQRVPAVENLHVNRGLYPAEIGFHVGLHELRAQMQREGTLSVAADRTVEAALRANLSEEHPPPMDPRLFMDLERYFQLANAGLNDLLDQDVTRHWW